MRYSDIDWNRMWQDSRTKKSWKKRKDKDWDKRAPSFASRNVDSPYVDQFLGKVAIAPDWSVLDIGCGPGTLALPLARRVKKVTAVDFSGAMLEELEKRAKEQNINNIETIKASWEDDWQALGIEKHHVTLSSRSLSVNDLEGALKKMDAWATKAAYISDRVGAGPFDPDLFQAVGRDFDPGPDYIFTVNILYTLGIHAHVDFISLDQNREYASKEEALDSYGWMLEPMNDAEKAKLKAYVEDRLTQIDATHWQLQRTVPPKWALLWWRKN